MRKNELSFSNVICCLLVIFIHVNAEAMIDLNRDSIWHAISYISWQAASFVVYAFVFLSGIKLFMKKDINISEFFKKRLIKVIIPYIIWVLLYYAYDLIMIIKIFDIKSLLYYIFTGDYIGHFYFVIIIVQFYILMPLWIKLFKSVNPIIMLTVSFIISLLSWQLLPSMLYFRFFDRIFTTYLFFWTLGAYIGMNYEKAKEFFEKYSIYIYVLFGIAFISAMGYIYVTDMSNSYTWYSEYIMMAYRIIAVIFLFTISLTGINKICNLSFVKLIDMSSYNIYLSHLLVQKPTTYILNAFRVGRISHRMFLRSTSVYVISIGLCTLYTYIKNKRKH